ncbi:AraC family transcriptional regulator [Cryptosporangium sp. NPDC048952]|uniref:AraC family transcriptional regulator n=1 Tax=Cryptosporangium sp. NPDC048952 TaxID=3363961 RepID=UPI00371E19BE
MDVVSEAISSVRVGRAEACWVTGAGAWGLRYPGYPVSGFHILIRGEGWLITPTDAPRAVAPGDVVFTAAGAPHGLSHAPTTMESLPQAVLGAAPRVEDADSVFLCGAYWLTDASTHPYLRSLPGALAVTPTDRHLRALVDLLDAEVATAAPGGSISRPALLDLVLTHVLRELLAQHPPEDGVDDPAIAAVVRQIRTDPEKPWTAQELSDRAGLPRREFSRRFAEVTGRPLRAYLTESRLALGAHLLHESDLTLAAIARRVGYSTEFAFGAAFRREYGVSPGNFRKSRT